MNRTAVVWVLRLDAAFNFTVGAICYLFYKPLIAAMLFPDTDKPLYANVMGAGIMGLSIVAWLASNRPETSREFIGAIVVTRLFVAPTILYWLLIAGIDLPPVWLGLAAVGAQVALVSGEALYLYASRTSQRASAKGTT